MEEFQKSYGSRTYLEWEAFNTFGAGKHVGLSKEFMKDWTTDLDCIEYASTSTWWELKAGSRLLIWRWTPSFRMMAQDGILVCWLDRKRPTTKKLLIVASTG